MAADGPVARGRRSGMDMAWRSYRHADKGYTEPIAAAPPSTTRCSTNITSTKATTTSSPAAANWEMSASACSARRSQFLVRHPHYRRRSQRCRLHHARDCNVSSWWDKWIIDGIGVNGPAILARMLSYPARLFEWGLVQWYALVMTAGLVGFVFYYVYH